MQNHSTGEIWRLLKTKPSRGIADYSVSIDRDDLLDMPRQLQRLPFVVLVSFSRPMSRQAARLLTEADVSGCSAPRVRSRASRTSLSKILLSRKPCFHRATPKLVPNVLSQQSGGQDSEQTLRVLGEPHSALAGGFPADSISGVGCNVVGILRVDQQRNAERCTWIHSLHMLFTIKHRISLHHVSKIVVQKFCLVCPLVGRFWKGCKHHAPTRRLHFLLPFFNEAHTSAASFSRATMFLKANSPV